MKPEVILEKTLPDIPWRVPVAVRLFPMEPERYGCRFCIALHGLRSENIKFLPTTLEAWGEHMVKEHGR